MASGAGFGCPPSNLTGMPVRTQSVHTRRRVLPAIAAFATLLAVAGCDSAKTDDAASSIVRTTTVIAGAGVVGTDRDTRTACPAPTPPDRSAGTHTITHAAGESTVPADPQRIVVLSTQALDTACALGLWERVVGAATLNGPSLQPSYLGTGIALIPSIGSIGSPDVAKIAELQPDLILGSQPLGSDEVRQLDGIAPTIFDGVAGDWQAQFLVGADALGRKAAATQALADYQRDARDAGVELNSMQTQASVVRFGADSIRTLGPETFAGKILADTGVRRPAYQNSASTTIDAKDLDNADADIVYVSFDGDQGREYGESVMKTDAWKDLGAAEDHRIFAVDDTIWSGNGLVAARALVADIRMSLNGFVSG